MYDSDIFSVWKQVDMRRSVSFSVQDGAVKFYIKVFQMIISQQLYLTVPLYLDHCVT